jgi:hypothetical protein
MLSATSPPQVSMASPIPPQSLENLLNYLSVASVACGAIGSISALGVDFLRRRVRAKAAEYAAENAFSQVVSSVSHLQETLDRHIQTSQDNHSELSQRVSRLEGRKYHD